METGLDPARIRLDSRLLHDLGIDGEEAVVLFEKFSREFGVDITALLPSLYILVDGGRVHRCGR
jgi:hypothetical protein